MHTVHLQADAHFVHAQNIHIHHHSLICNLNVSPQLLYQSELDWYFRCEDFLFYFDILLTEYLNPVGVNGYILSETHKTLNGADDRCVFQEADYIMDVCTLWAIISHLMILEDSSQFLLPDPVSLRDHYTGMRGGSAEITGLSESTVYSNEPERKREILQCYSRL